MAITDTNESQQQFNKPTTEQAGRAESSKQTQPQKQWSFTQAGLFGAPLSKGIGSEFYSKLKTKLAEAYQQASPGTQIAIIDLDKENIPTLEYSCLVIAAQYKDRPSVGVAYHILILESTSDKLSSVIESINGEQIEMLRVTSDALDDELAHQADLAVQRAFPNGPWYMVDGCVVPRDFNLDDKFAIHNLALNTGLAIGNELAVRSPGFNDINLAIMPKDSSLTVTVNVNRQQVPDAVGRPMRNDVSVVFGSRSSNQQAVKRMAVNTGDKDIVLSKAGGFIDLVYAPSADSSGYNPYAAPNQLAKTQKYAARLVLTNLVSEFSYTMASTLLNLYSAIALADDNNWFQAFRPSTNFTSKVDLTDIGALNIDANLYNEPSGHGTPIDTKTENFRLAELGQLMTALIQPGMIISLDCPEVGAQTWYTSAFASASAGSSNAYDVIYRGAMELTNGNFERYFPRGSQMFTDSGNRVHLGTYIGPDGSLRDIRDFDYLAVCNLVGTSNPTIIRDWSDTFFKTQYPMVQRLAARKKMIQSFSNETAEFTGFASRVTFSGQFLDALIKAIRETGVNIRIISAISGAAFNDQRGVASFTESALLNPVQTFAKVGGFNTNGAFQPTQHRFS